jgi:hypothetical protein
VQLDLVLIEFIKVEKGASLLTEIGILLENVVCGQADCVPK